MFKDNKIIWAAKSLLGKRSLNSVNMSDKYEYFDIA